MTPHILLTNDDGVRSPGLAALKRALDGVGRVSVIAPDQNRSAIGRGITIGRPLTVEETTLGDGSRAYATDGTPVDCVRLAALGLVGEVPDLIVSGINLGLNLGDDVTYSGTVAAALEGVLLGIPAIAASQEALPGGEEGAERFDFTTVAAFVARLVPRLMAERFPRDILLSVNAPGRPPQRVGGARVTRLGRRTYDDRLTLESREGGRHSYRIYGKAVSAGSLAGTDIEAVEQGFVSVTPLHFELTDAPGMDAIARWGVTDLIPSGPGTAP